MSEAVHDILERIQHLPAAERLELEDLLAQRAEAEWQREAEEARRSALEKSIEQAMIDRAVEKARLIRGTPASPHGHSDSRGKRDDAKDAASRRPRGGTGPVRPYKRRRRHGWLPVHASHAPARAPSNSIAALDLRYKLVRNSTGRPFITSDHPVAAYNQFYEANSPGFSETGLQSRGLQLFFPLSPKYLFVLFDSDVYKIGGRIYDRTPVNATEADVEWLNVLQVVNAGESLFFSDAADEEYVRSIVAKAESHKRTEKGKADVIPAEHFGLPDGKIIAGRGVDARIGLRLTFIGRQPSASQFRSLVAGQRLRKPALVDRLTRTGKSVSNLF